jgi:hypothetical protein
MGLRASVTAAAEHRGVQGLLALALLVPLVATAGQYWASGFWRQSLAVGVLFWPGLPWHWTVQMNAAVAVGGIGVLYVAGIARLLRERTLAIVVLACIGGTIVAVLAGKAVNHFTGWREMQALGSFDMTGRVNQMILAQWHNPLWEEVMFRALPLAVCAWLAKRRPIAAKWIYYVVPAAVFAEYHVPGHGYARITDTFILGAIFAWIALRYSLWAVLVLHCILDAISVLSLAHMKGVPPLEVTWLADHFGALNSTFFLAGMGAILLFVYQASRFAILNRKSGLSRSVASCS